MAQKDSEKIERYIDGKADNNEKEWVESLFLQGEENYTLRQMVEKDWNNMLKNPSTSDYDLTHLLDRVHHTIRTNEDKKKRSILQKFTKGYMKVAAILLLPLLLAGIIGYRHLNTDSQANVNEAVITTTDQPVLTTIFAPMGSRVSFNLPDGTNGMLNSGSRLSYSLPFSDKRQIKLEGEAWFDVTHDEKHPFEISTGNSTVNVLGTNFNLSAYPAENYVEVVLLNGKVEFKNNKNEEKVIMRPLERLVFHNGNISKSITDPSKYNAWTEGKLVFRGDLMAEVGRRLERWYNVNVVIADKELEKYSFRATFEDDKIEEVLRFLSMTSPIRYSISPRKILSNGTYDKEKVTIYLKN